MPVSERYESEMDLRLAAHKEVFDTAVLTNPIEARDSKLEERWAENALTVNMYEQFVHSLLCEP